MGVHVSVGEGMGFRIFGLGKVGNPALPGASWAMVSGVHGSPDLGQGLSSCVYSLTPSYPCTDKCAPHLLILISVNDRAGWGGSGAYCLVLQIYDWGVGGGC